MNNIGEVNSNYEDDSDDDSFNSCVGYLKSDLYDDVLFQHAMVPKDTLEQDSLIMRPSDSFSSAYSTRISHPQPNTVNNIDEESCTSSHLLSTSASNDDDLSFITDDTSFDEKMGMGMGGIRASLSVVSSGEREEQREALHFCNRAPEAAIAADSSKFDEWSMMSHPDDDVICDLEDVTSAMASPSENMTRTSAMAVPPLDKSTGYFSRSTF